ncbi:hypothetical protein KUTeg_003002 [Tegillarca granosa]|uniref:Uncharacterized protein n=1 Tax=Tegillarca granosa TaxID=220873 RepID=A0ABQ9FMG1_TEGGR|nr:hypothetical protein KUTeg_003002 [Tegillarca granosa]
MIGYYRLSASNNIAQINVDVLCTVTVSTRPFHNRPMLNVTFIYLFIYFISFHFGEGAAFFPTLDGMKCVNCTLESLKKF